MSIGAILLLALLASGCYGGDLVEHAQRRGLCNGRGRGWVYVTTNTNAMSSSDLESFRCVHEDTVLARDSVGWALR